MIVTGTEKQVDESGPLVFKSRPGFGDGKY
jgi:hypothetical protein